MKETAGNKKKESAYLRLYRRVREDILNGVYPFGAKLPSKRSMTDASGVSTVTVEHAYSLLCDEGYAESRERSGYFVTFSPGDVFSSSVSPEPTVFSAAEKESVPKPEFPVSVLTKTMRRVMNDYGDEILARSPNEGCVRLREAIKNYLARSRGIRADVSQIVVGAGSEYLYGLIVETLGRNRVYAIEEPSYKKIEQVYTASGVKYEKLPLGQNGIDSRALKKSRADVLHISPYRSFPSGVTADASKRHEYIRWAENGRYLVEDDFESEFTVLKKPEETLFALSDRENVIYVNTFSMTVSPSLRVGYMILPPGLCEEFRKKAGFYSCTVPTFMQFVLAELISNGDLERHVNRVRRKKRNEMNK